MNIVEQIFSVDRLAEIGSVVALKWAAGSITYQELADKIQAASLELNRHGVSIGERVVFQCADTAEFVIWYFAVLNIGAVSIAVSTRLGREDLYHVIQDSEANALIFDSTTAETCQTISGDSVLIRINLNQVSLDERISEVLNTVERESDHEALWVYSSGSTSRPKGIVHTHRCIRDCCGFHTDTLNISVGELLFCTSRISFAYALANGLLAPLQLGATVYLHPDWITPDELRSIIRIERPQVVFAVPSIYRGILDLTDTGDDDEFASVEFYVSAGEYLPSELQSRWEEYCGRTIINVYGCSETLFLALTGSASNTPPASVGNPLTGVIPYLVDPADSVSVSQGQEGVLHIEHPFMFTHYANRSKDTEYRLRGARFNTGDLYRQDASGNWYHLGREDDLLKVAGQWVYLREIETVGQNSQLAIDVAVIGAKDNVGSIRPALFFVPNYDSSYDEAVSLMHKHIERNLPMFKRPKWIRAIDDFPKTANGKLSRSALQRIVEGQSRD